MPDELRLLTDNGVRLFPCRGKAPAVPRGSDWRQAATTDLGELRAIARQNGGDAWGACIPEGMLVVDLDCKQNGPNGVYAWAALVKEHGSPDKWAAAQTQSGGKHLWFRRPEGRPDTGNKTGLLPPGIDVRGGGFGYVVVPPSRGYHWLLPPGSAEGGAPDWLLGMLEAEREHSQKEDKDAHQWRGHKGNAGDYGEDHYGMVACEDEARRVAQTAEGGRNQALFKAAFKLGTIIAAGRLDHGRAQRALEGAASQCGLGEREATKTIASGLRAGLDKPRQGVGGAKVKDRRCDRPDDAAGQGSPESLGDDPPPPTDNDMPPDLASSLDKVLLEGATATDVGNAELLVELYGDGLLYCYPWASWLRWRGGRWERDTGGHIDSIAVDVCKELLRRAVEVDGKDARKRAFKRAHAAQSIGRRQAMARTAQHMREVRVEELDSDDMVLACDGGQTFELRSGVHRESRMEDRCTRKCGAMVAQADELEAPTWRRFLHDIFLGDHDLIAFVRRAAGYSLTGDTSEQCLFLLVGHEGANGKSTFLNTLCHVWGEYAYVSAISTFMQSDKGRNKDPAIAELHGPRLVAASEPEAGSKLDESLVKRITGSEPLTAARKYEREFTFVPKCKLWLACNTPPRLPRGGSSMARRMMVVPFDYVVPEGARDKGLEARLKGEAAGILNWALRGCLEWQAEGLAPPDRVRTAGDSYMAEQDPIAEWLAECTVQAAEAWSTLAELHGSYCQHMEAAGARAVSRRALGGMLRERGLETRRRSLGMVVHGVQLTN